MGRILVDGAKTIRLFGEEYVVKARVETLGGLSAHAGQTELVQWISGFQPPPRTLLVHGEPRAQDALAERLWRECNLKVEIPARGRSYEDGKKITWKDGLKALYCIFRYRIAD